jgi:hypothetical protein
LQLRTILLALILAAALPHSADASRQTSKVLVTFRPTTSIGAAVPKFVRPVDGEPLMLVFEDGRTEEQRRLLGTRTNNADRLFNIETSNDLVEVADRGLRSQALRWGVRVAHVAASTRLTITITQVQVSEVNQVVGASYKSTVVLHGRLSDSSGVLWEGVGRGGTSRYGRAASDENTSEVISDGLVEAFAHLLSDRALQAAWRGEEPPSVPAAAATVAPKPTGAAPMSPEEMLEKLLDLQRSNFSDDTLVQYLGPRQLSRELSAEDLIAWKQAGLSETVVQAAMALPVASSADAP